ncbi:hypothetical protein GCM10011386_03160 [Parapedobacter defluvii]|uniref:FAD dependent oxidoreductase n=1 Tax=Parapedobacter defluvii TaxID=2045106 RepID=A0ABQ1L2E7_9SPHI|nr:FAD-dependent oxidoreductase [Parapedobacter defluvii]GGC14790.1 hypothetical protein GCM10011386_03160 [Parapedobacter defluvii]
MNASQKEHLNVDLVIVGAGSGGVAAAIAAGRLGITVLLVEKQHGLGGNASLGGVNVWEMGVGGTGIPFEIYKRLKTKANGVGIYRFNIHRKWQQKRGEQPLHPGAELTIDPSLRYVDTLLRHGSETGIDNEAFVRANWHGVPFDPNAYQEVLRELLAESGYISVRLGTTFNRIISGNDGRLHAVELEDGTLVYARYFIDATDNAYLCEAAGAQLCMGQESREVYGEPDAPLQPTQQLNGVSLIYRIGKAGEAEEEEMPTLAAELATLPDQCWWAADFPLASIVQYPNGDLNVNMLPTMEGAEFAGLASYEIAYAECRKRVLAHFRYIRETYPPYRNYVIKWLAPRLGVREGRRIIAAYQLTQHDLLKGLAGQDHPDIIAIADHPMDTHGSTTGRAGCVELDQPYGIPFRSLIPKGFRNLLIASRAAGFSSLAASSCRLTRTMMQLGQAAGSAAGLASVQDSDFPELDAAKLRESLKQQHVQLTYPMEDHLKNYLTHE